MLFNDKTGYYFKPLIPETMKLLKSTKIEVISDENGKNVLHLEIIEVVLVHYIIVNSCYQYN